MKNIQRLITSMRTSIKGWQRQVLSAFDINRSFHASRVDFAYPCHPARLALEAHTMQEWLMNEPANDINAYIYDNHDSSRVRFILKRHPDTSENRFLVLFCNFSNDQNNHTTYMHFPNKTINDLDEVQPYLTGDFSVEGSGHTIKFVPNNMDSKDVYARACFVEFN